MLCFAGNGILCRADDSPVILLVVYSVIVDNQNNVLLGKNIRLPLICIRVHYLITY